MDLANQYSKELWNLNILPITKKYGNCSPNTDIYMALDLFCASFVGISMA